MKLVDTRATHVLSEEANMPFVHRCGPPTAWLWLVLCVAAPAATAQEKSDPEAVRQYRVAFGFQKRQLFPQSIARWKTFLSEHGKDPLAANATFNLGVCEFRAEQLPQAADTFRQVIAKFPKYEQRDAARFNLGLVLYNTALASEKPDDFRAAAKEFAAIPDAADNAADARYYQAECLYAAEAPDEAVGVYEQLLAKHGQAAIVPDALYALGTLQQDRGEAEKAAEAFGRLLKDHEESPLANEARLRLAVAQLELEKFADAEKHLAALDQVEEFPYADYALLQRARCRFEQDDFPKAAELYESLPKRFAESPYANAARVSAGRARFRAEQYPQAKADLEQVAATKEPEAVEASYWLARTLLETEQPAEVVKVVDRALPASGDGPWKPQLEFTKIEARSVQPEQLAAATAEFADFAKRHAEHELAPEALYRAAIGALQTDDPAAARTHSDAFLARDDIAEHELRPEVLFVSGESRLLAEEPDFAAAEEQYRKLVGEYEEHPRRPQARLRIGLCLFEREQFDQAVQELQAALPELKDKPLVAEARLIEGRAHAAMERTPQAIDALRKAWSADAEEWERGDEVLFELATNLRKAEDADDAEKEFDRLADTFEESPLRDRALYAMGELRAAKDEHDQAAAAFEQLVKEHPESELVPASLYAQAAAWFDKPDDDRAIAALDRLLKDHAESDVAGEAHLLRGLSRQRDGKAQDAVADFKAFIATEPEADRDVQARMALSRAHTTLEQHDQTIAVLTGMLSQYADHPRADRARYDLGFAQLDAEKAAEAAATFRTLAEKHPDSPLVAESWFRVGERHESDEKLAEAAQAYAAGLAKAKRPELRERLLYKNGWIAYATERHADALEPLETLVKEFPEGDLAAEGVFLLGECRFQRDEFAEALPWLTKAATGKAEEHRPRALYRAGDAAAALEKWDDSRKFYEQLLDEHPDFPQASEARYGIGLAHQKQDRYDEARKVYEQIAKGPASETAAKARFMMGECAFSQKDYETAVEDFLDAALGYEYDEWQALGHFEAARCFVQLKDVDRAKAECRTVVEKFPDHPRAKDAANLLKSLGS